MQVEWTSYSSPLGVLTVVECEAGPLVVEYPNRAVTIKWAVRLRAAVPELHIAQGSCRRDHGLAGRILRRISQASCLSRPPEALVRSLTSPDRRLQGTAKNSLSAKPVRMMMLRGQPGFIPAK